MRISTKLAVVVAVLGLSGAVLRAQEGDPGTAGKIECAQGGKRYQASMAGSSILFVDLQFQQQEAALQAAGLETVPVPPRDAKGAFTRNAYHLLRRQVPGLVRRIDLAAIFGGATLARNPRPEVFTACVPSLLRTAATESGVTVTAANRAEDQFVLQLDANLLPVKASINGTNFPVLTTGEIPIFPEGDGGTDWRLASPVEVDGFAGKKMLYRLTAQFALSPSKRLSDTVYDFTKLVDAETGCTITYRTKPLHLVQLKGGFLGFGAGRQEDTYVFQSSSTRIDLADRPFLAVAESGRQVQQKVSQGISAFARSRFQPKAVFEQLKPRNTPYVVLFKDAARPYFIADDGNSIWITFKADWTGEELSVQVDLNGPTGQATFDGKAINLPSFQLAMQED